MNKLFLIVSVSVVQVVVRDYQKHDVHDDGRRAVSALEERYQLAKEQDYSQNDRENGLFVGKGKSDKSCQDFESVKRVKSYESAEGPSSWVPVRSPAVTSEPRIILMPMMDITPRAITRMLAILKCLQPFLIAVISLINYILFILHKVSDFGEQLNVFRYRCRFCCRRIFLGFLNLCRHLVERLEDEEKCECGNQERDYCLNEVSVHYGSTAYGDGKGSEVDLTEDKSEYRSDDILVQGSHYSGERSTDDNADCHAHYIALRNKLFKFTNESFQYYYLLYYNHTN